MVSALPDPSRASDLREMHVSCDVSYCRASYWTRRASRKTAYLTIALKIISMPPPRTHTQGRWVKSLLRRDSSATRARRLEPASIGFDIGHVLFPGWMPTIPTSSVPSAERGHESPARGISPQHPANDPAEFRDDLARSADSP